MRDSIRVTPPVLFLICSSFLTATLAQSPVRYTITGDLRDEDGKTFSGATVCAIPFDGSIVRVREKICAESDAQGKFVIKLTQVGNYQIVAEKVSEGYMPSYVPFYKNPHTPITEAVVNHDSPAASVSFVIGPQSGVITGKVIDEAADTPIQSFTVWVWHPRDQNARYHEVVEGTNSQGRFKLFAPTVPFRLRVVADGYEDWDMGGGQLMSAAGPRKGPGSMMTPPGKTSDFAVYMKRKNPLPVDPTRGDQQRLVPPAQVNPVDNRVFDVIPRMIELKWAPMIQAVSYGVEVEACWKPPLGVRWDIPDDGECINPSPHFEKVGILGTTIEFRFRGAQPGRWRVWAIDKSQRPGLKSRWRRFVYAK